LGEYSKKINLWKRINKQLSLGSLKQPNGIRHIIWEIPDGE